MRRRAAKRSVQFSLFPFLAVLLCTMGSLIVLLLVLVQQARVEAKEQPTLNPEASIQLAAQQAQREEQLAADKAHLAKLDVMAQQLDELRSALQEKLQSSRMQLSHLEDHTRRLRRQLEQMQADYQVLSQANGQDANARQQQRIELRKLQEQIAAATVDLQQAKEAAAAKPRSYSIVPYDGPQGTRRRPIYLECRADHLIIQPEGHVLALDDMESAGPGNPLAAALRATREHLLTNDSLRGGEPYPLLLVRPDGAKTYSAARSAMSSWGSEFGYELIDAEMPLEFPPADEALGDVVRRAVDLARQRQTALAAARSRNSGGRSSVGGPVQGAGIGGTGPSPGGTYLAPSRNGGFEVRGRSGGSDWLDAHVARPGNGPNDSSATGSANQGIGGSGAPSGQNSPHEPATSANNQQFAQGGGFYATEQPESTPGNRGNSSTPQEGNAVPSATGNYAAGQGEAAVTLFNNPNAQSSSAQDRPQDGNPTSVAQSRGSDWALPASARGATPFRRPIRVVVKQDQLLVLPDRGDDSRPRVVQLEGGMQRTIDHFVSQLWEHMNGWGIAGSQAYWKPILSVEVAPGGEARFAELSALMQQSGVEVERKR